MKIIPMLLKEMEQEAQTTRKMLERIPTDKFDWAPHVKSMDIRRLANHIAEIPGWVAMAITTDELDFAANPYEPTYYDTPAELLDLLEQTLAQAKAELENTTEEILLKRWVLRNGDVILSEGNKLDMIRVAFSQTVHHRAQLGVYLRLLNVPIPGSYGPSADDLAAREVAVA